MPQVPRCTPAARVSASTSDFSCESAETAAGALKACGGVRVVVGGVWVQDASNAKCKMQNARNAWRAPIISTCALCILNFESRFSLHRIDRLHHVVKAHRIHCCRPGF